MTVFGCAHVAFTPPVEVGRTVTTEISAYMALAGHGWTYTVSESDLADSPAWADPSNMPPPLSLANALAVSRAELSRYMPEVETWDLAEVDLQQIGYDGKWVYLVGWRPRGLEHGDNLDIPVLMSGHAVLLEHQE